MQIRRARFRLTTRDQCCHAGAALRGGAAGARDGRRGETVAHWELEGLARQIAASYREEHGGPDWWEMSEADRMSNRRAADHIAVKLRAVGAAEADDGFSLTPHDIAMLAEMEHRRRCAEKLLDGWRPLSATPANIERWQHDRKMVKRQTLHIDLRPFSVLSEHEKGKDRLQIESIPRFAAELGLRGRRGA